MKFFRCKIFNVIINLLIVGVIISLVSMNVNLQKIKYATRIRNFTIYSETNSLYMTEMKIFHHNIEDRLSVTFNITKDVTIKRVALTILRCTLGRFMCENFQTWSFPDNLGRAVFMKNTIWTPMFQGLTPRPKIPFAQKAVYRQPNGTLNAEKLMAFYPDAAKYYWKVDLEAIDVNQEKPILLFIEFHIFEYVDHDRKKPKTK